MYKLYGIPNCDTVKKARTFLDKKKISYEFVDFKKSPPKAEDISRFKAAFGDWPLNKKGPTFRKNQEAWEKLKSDPEKINFILQNTSMIKRPILEKNGKVIAFGFKEEEYFAL